MTLMRTLFGPGFQLKRTVWHHPEFLKALLVVPRYQHWNLAEDLNPYSLICPEPQYEFLVM